MTLRSLETYGYIDSKTKSYRNIKRIFSAIYLPSRPRSSGRMPSDLISQAACLQILSFKPHIFKILDKCIRPNFGFQIRSNNLNPPFAESLVDSVPGGPHGDIGNQLLSCYCIAVTRAIEYQGAVLVMSNKLYSHHPNSGSKGLRLLVKLLTWLGLICMMTKSLPRNCKAMRGDLDP